VSGTTSTRSREALAMTIERRDDVPKPSYLPANPSVGELVTEIDRARHDAAHTLEALVEKLDVKARVKHETQARRQQVVAATPESVAKALGKTAEYTKRVPVPARIGAAVVLVFLLLWRRRR
jgi:hypothetical protein